MKDIYVVVITIDEVANILGSFENKDAAIDRAEEEISRAQTIYARAMFGTVPPQLPRVYHMSNTKSDSVFVVKVKHYEQLDTKA
jgi:hypothetical protein